VDLIKFLRARLDEDEAVAVRTVNAGRLFREIAAKRAILARHLEVQAWSYPPGDGDEAVQDELARLVRLLATVYSDHPDYPLQPAAAS
jgi:cytidylate kinase